MLMIRHGIEKRYVREARQSCTSVLEIERKVIDAQTGRVERQILELTAACFSGAQVALDSRTEIERARTA